MAKVSTAKVSTAKAKSSRVPNKAIYSRVSYLYQAAAYMAAQQEHCKSAESQTTKGNDYAEPDGSSAESLKPLFQCASRRLVAEFRAVSHKALLRISPAMKHSICKGCDTMLIDGSTCTNEIENRSRGGKKPWADVLVRKCSTCGLAKRFPVAAKRQKRKQDRGFPEEIAMEADP
ncbi:uncharacterized protein L3040_000144 [Drepanopeziza brunnea f. sp. 'multigermtubi']|uniref:RNAse P Rpr2/Rpp21/SNM1 subunit domain-containing protein n=1 Tax=Marssonina brunnea f. sp. multigermtubi (strain MB_m1) TaxID=1072389 RepID=K1WBC9_MARBU|nr:RNAse P Rpr2/Rpp21/SNM1 subunit domain-containing protein [Drepanopeziza brunnea f. sp. 'multigermtubi' MB_m1]EKD14620.1 RNAse P Rpr2/Rpp21/SNM1 subunit domain-containing protein [Drepanopeziza brunnea f. sp. 'multigermtubi' MB_m1]KAJ5053854.1 hypothetical protein L3040_000144 [Drepanopeziza brunnea f. sp. 'multigermtubi']